MPSTLIAITLLLTIQASTVCSQEVDCKTTYLCTDAFCGSQCGPKDCFIPVEECEGILLQLYENPNDFCSCCPHRCVTYLKEDELCSNSVDKPYPDTVCGPRLSKYICPLKCVSLSHMLISGCQFSAEDNFRRCRPINTDCLKELANYNIALEDGTLGMNVNAPECDEVLY